jgi:DNA-binding NarL/FixJ family response regulator
LSTKLKNTLSIGEQLIFPEEDTGAVQFTDCERQGNQEAPVERPTPCEKDVLRVLAGGLSYEEIAKRLSLDLGMARALVGAAAREVSR